MEEFDRLIETICNGATPAQTRTAAEQRLMEVLCNLNSWKQYANLLYQASDTVCFFICIGFQKLVWRHWRNIAMEDRLMLNQTIIQTLTNRTNIQAFAKSKLEQVLAAICANSCSIEPALGMLSDTNNPHVNTGISAMRTVLELILSEDPQLFPEFRPTLLSAVNDIVVPLTNLACNACNTALHNAEGPKEKNSLTVTASLDLLKVIVLKLQIGPHVTADVIDLLFRVAELSTTPNNIHNNTHSGTQHIHNNINTDEARRAALSAIEILTEIMGKKYLPPRGNNNNHINTSTSSGGSSGSDSLYMLKEILVKTVLLLQKIRSGGSSLSDSPIVISLLEFIAVFAESHLMRCISLSSLSNGDNSPDTGSFQLNPATSSVDVNMNQAVVGFFEELVATTTSTLEPEVLSRIVVVWNRVLHMGSVKDTLCTQSGLCVSMVSHLIRSCLTSSNEYMRDSVDELIEDCSIDIMVDPHIRSVLSHIYDSKTSSSGSCGGGGSGSGSNGVLSAEEVGYAGTVLLEDCRDLFTELIVSPEVHSYLSNSVTQLVMQNITTLSSGKSSSASSASVDLHYLVSLLPLCGTPVVQLIAQLSSLATQLVESQLYSRGKEFVVLVVTCCQLAGRLLQSGGVVSVHNANSDMVNSIQHLYGSCLIPCLTRITAAHSTGTSSGASTTTTATIHTAVSILFLQSVTVYIDILDADNAQCAEMKATLIELMQGIMVQSPLESLVLLMCVQDLLQPHSVAQGIVAQCLELVAAVDSASAQGYVGMDASIVGQLTKVTAALDGLARNHALSRPARRQNLIAHFAPLQTFMGKYVTTLFRLLLHTYTSELNTTGSSGSSGSSSVSPTIGSGSGGSNMSSGEVCYLSRLVISLSCALLQSLGKKSFGKAAADVLNIAVDFAENISGLPPAPNSSTGGGGSSASQNRLLSTAGLPLTKQLLELTQVLAESTAASSPTVNLQASSTHRLLCFIAGGLSDDRVCAELLQPTLKAGVTAVRCYWQKTHKNLPFLASIAGGGGPGASAGPQSSFDAQRGEGGSQYPDIDGENVRPIAVLLTQLCVGSLSPTVSPQDTLTALEGLILLSEQHSLFGMNWFQNQCWASLLTPCLKAVLLRVHSMHRPQLEQVLIALASAGEAAYLAMARNNIPAAHSSQSLPSLHGLQNSPHASSPSVHGGSVGSNGSPHSVDVGEILYAKYQEFWVSIGSEMIGIAAQYNCGEMASHTLYSVLNSYQAAAVAAGQFSAGISNISPHSTSRGPFLVDMRIFLDKIILPVSSEIARLH